MRKDYTMSMLDTHTILTIIATALIGGLVGLDRTAVGQFMISQPIVAAPLIGWILGDVTAGLVIGASLELIWVLDMPIGSFVPANSTISSISATAIAILASNHHASLSVIGFSLLLTTGMVPLTMIADTMVRQWNSRLSDIVLASHGVKMRAALAKAHFLGLAAFYLKSCILYLIFLPVGIIAVAIFTNLPENFHRAMSFFVKLLPLLGSAMMVRNLSPTTFDVFLLTGFTISAISMPVFHTPEFTIMLLLVTGVLLGARSSEVWR